MFFGSIIDDSRSIIDDHMCIIDYSRSIIDDSKSDTLVASFTIILLLK